MNHEMEKFEDVILESLNNRVYSTPYVVSYKMKSDDSLIGYHLSTFCQLTDDKYKAKRYDGDNPYGQLQTIHNNIKNVLSTKEDDTGFFGKVRWAIKQDYFRGLTIDDIYIDAVFLDDDAPKQKYTLTRVD